MALVSEKGSAFQIQLTTGQPVEGSFGRPITISVFCCSGADVVCQGHSLLHVLLLIVSEMKAGVAVVGHGGGRRARKRMLIERKEE
jgi:hypothetical protein